MNVFPTVLARAQHALGEFFRLESSAGMVLVVAAALALGVANSPLAGWYDIVRDAPLGEGIWAHSLHWWTNDALMALFFLLVSLEIKREVVSGQLSSRAQLMQPVVCACAGVAVPALIFVAFNHGNAETLRGWAVPTATDIAFSLGVLALLGARVPLGMKVMLSTIAVADDLIAIVIIAVFYSNDLRGLLLLAALGVALLMYVLNRKKVRALTPYLLLGLLLWALVLQSGVHATLAGVVTGLMIPHVDPDNAIDDAAEYSPLESLEHALHPWVAWGILPLFAFLNAGLELCGLRMADLTAALPAGIALGLIVGKPVGIVGAAVLLRSFKIAQFPDGMDFRAMLGLGLLCGIGFTMSLFVGSLAYARLPLDYTESVLGVLGGSLVSAVLGLVWLYFVLPKRQNR